MRAPMHYRRGGPSQPLVKRDRLLPVGDGGAVADLGVDHLTEALGRLFFTSVLQRDHTVIMALSTATAFLVLLGTLAADLLYGVVDPRVSHG